MNETIAIVSLIFSGIMLLISAITIIRVFSKDSRESSDSLIRVETKIDNMGEQITEVRDDVKAQSVQYVDMDKRVTRVEESTKSAHHRIDGIEEKINKGMIE